MEKNTVILDLNEYNNMRYEIDKLTKLKDDIQGCIEYKYEDDIQKYLPMMKADRVDINIEKLMEVLDIDIENKNINIVW